MTPEVEAAVERHYQGSKHAVEKGYLAVEIRSRELMQLCQALRTLDAENKELMARINSQMGRGLR